MYIIKLYTFWINFISIRPYLYKYLLYLLLLYLHLHLYLHIHLYPDAWTFGWVQYCASDRDIPQNCGSLSKSRLSHLGRAACLHAETLRFESAFWKGGDGQCVNVVSGTKIITAISGWTIRFHWILWKKQKNYVTRTGFRSSTCTIGSVNLKHSFEQKDCRSLKNLIDSLL